MATGNIPLMREHIKAVLGRNNLTKLDRQCLEDALELSFRDKYKPRQASATRTGFACRTDDELKEVLRFMAANPSMSNRAVGALFKLDGGRISELGGSMTTARLKRLRKEVEDERKS